MSMKLKEVLNIRKLKEEFYDIKDHECSSCPFDSVCSRSFCVVNNIFENTTFSDDLYEMERKGTLTEEYQIDPVKNLDNLF